MKVIKWLDNHAEEAFMVVCLILIACIMMAQIIARKLPFIKPFEWAEELCRFLWIMSVFVSLPYTIRKESIISVGVLVDFLPEKARKVVRILVDIVIIAAVGICAYYSIGVFKKIQASGEISPAMGMPMTAVYIFMVIGFFLATFRGIQMLVIHLKHFNEKSMTTLEQTMADAKSEASAVKERS